MDFIAFESGIPRVTLLRQYTMPQIFLLFFRFRIFKSLDHKMSATVYDKKDLDKVNRQIAGLSDVFYVEGLGGPPIPTQQQTDQMLGMLAKMQGVGVDVQT